MCSPNYIGRCQSVGLLSDSANRSCFAVTLTESAVSDAETFHESLRCDDDSSSWLEVDTSYTMIDLELLIGAALLIGLA